MITNLNLNKLYDVIIDGSELTTSMLNSYGFNSRDIKKLIDNGFIERIRIGYYSFIGVDKLYNYGEELIKQKENDKAINCFVKCYELDPSHPGANYQLFLYCLSEEDYEEAFLYLENYYKTSDMTYRADCNVYLCLLSMIMPLPDKFQNIVSDLNYKDILVDSFDKDFQFSNRMRLNIFNGRLRIAFKEINDLIARRGSANRNECIAIGLLSKQKALMDSNLIKINYLVKEKKYESLKEYLSIIFTNHNFSEFENILYKLVSDLLRIRENGIIPRTLDLNPHTVWEAISIKNYKVVKDLIHKYDINGILKKLLDEILEEIEKNHKENLKNSLINALFVADWSNVVKFLREYLKLFQKSNYEFLMIGLIKLSLLENDKEFTKPLRTLSALTTDNFVYNPNEYIQMFYSSLAQNKFLEARIYLEILKKTDVNEEVQSLIDGLELILLKTEKLTNYKVDYTIFGPFDKALQEVQNNLQESQSSLKSHETLGKDYVSSLLGELKEKGILILDTMTQEQRNEIHEEVKNIPEALSFEIELDESPRIVLKYARIDKEIINFNDVREEADKYYRECNYPSYINLYRKVLENVDNLRASFYRRLGAAYHRIGYDSLAIDYLTVATAISKQFEDGRYDSSDFISVIKADFREKMNYYYNIEYVQEISELIARGVSLEESCFSYGLNNKQMLKMSLILAREYYAQGNYAMGDFYLEKVERVEDKSAFISSLLFEIKSNKKFYEQNVDPANSSLRRILTSENN